MIDYSKISKDIFTPRELEIIKLIYDGLTNHAITDELNISFNNVKEHIRIIYRKIADRVDLNGYNPRIVVTNYYWSLKEEYSSGFKR